MDVDIERCRLLNDWLAGIEMPPEFTGAWAEAHLGDSGYYLVLSSADQPDAEAEGASVPGGVAVHVADTPLTRSELAVHVVRALVVRATHEAFEWVKVDGERVANPHPSAGEEMWEWLNGTCGEMVWQYINFAGSDPLLG